MRIKFLLAGMLAIPALVTALVYGRNIMWCSDTGTVAATTDTTDQSTYCPSDKGDCCPSDKSECCPQEQRAAVQTGLVCSLTPSQFSERRKELLGLFQQAQRVEDIANGLRFRFSDRPKLVTELAAAIEKERICCTFLRFKLIAEEGPGAIAFEVSGPSGTAEMLKSLRP